jgi:hypothetical protein
MTDESVPKSFHPTRGAADNNNIVDQRRLNFIAVRLSMLLLFLSFALVNRLVKPILRRGHKLCN